MLQLISIAIANAVTVAIAFAIAIAIVCVIATTATFFLLVSRVCQHCCITACGFCYIAGSIVLVGLQNIFHSRLFCTWSQSMEQESIFIAKIPYL